MVAIEDHRFFNHRGVDIIRIGGSFLHNLRGGSQGGSTLTQQLIKLTYFSTSASDRTLSRKIQEAWLATQLEKKATKQEILTYYVNKVFMANGNTECRQREKLLRKRSKIFAPQLALLAGMPQAPNNTIHTPS
ncbi:MAG: transglycosylase domain-containing protein [Streptococcus sp.]